MLADRGFWNDEQIGRIQNDGVRVLVPPLDRHAKAPENSSDVVQQMQATLATDESKQTYRRRAGIVEPVYAQIRHNRRITRILRRGQNAAQAEIDLIATTHNLLKLFRRPALTS